LRFAERADYFRPLIQRLQPKHRARLFLTRARNLPTPGAISLFSMWSMSVPRTRSDSVLACGAKIALASRFVIGQGSTPHE
jgi:hypothetical protein